MDSSTKLKLTNIGKIDHFKTVMEKLTRNIPLDEKESTYILTCAILFIQIFEQNKKLYSYIELAYYIILKYALVNNDYRPLYDFAINFGFYPISNAIIKTNLLSNPNLDDLIANKKILNYKKNNIVETLEQHIIRQNILDEDSSHFSFIAPTSFGKSSIIVEHINKYHFNKIGIIVPTKSLLNQTYRNLKKEMLPYKLILHDEMYNNESKFIGILTQERALRLLENNSLSFDILYIDEAHNLFKNDMRSILLTRLIRKNQAQNSNQKVVYLSPLINKSDNLLLEDIEISEHKINFNIKEPEYYLYDSNNVISKNNRFVNQFYKINEETNYFEYIIKNSTNKTFIYHRRPVNVEKFAIQLAQHLPKIESLEIENIKNILKEYVHKDFKLLDVLDKGIIYLHGKLPENIKDFLEYKYRTVPELKYLVANSVILEGVNLPISSLFIMCGYALNEHELTNLIGRVNRLNDIFQESAISLDLLVPQIHFIDSEEYCKSTKMKNKILLLRSKIFDDYIKNPLLKNYDINKVEKNAQKLQELKLNNEKIQEREQYILESQANIENDLKYNIIKNNVINFYKNSEVAISIIGNKIEQCLNDENYINKNIIDKFYNIFIEDLDNYIADYEIRRLKNDEARNFYKFFIKNNSKSLNQKITKQYRYFKRIKNSDRQDKCYYIGETFGEIKHPTRFYETPKDVYVNLKNKDDKALINLSIVKVCLEEDFVNYKLNNFFNLMLDLNLITLDEYNKTVLGTTNTSKIKLINLGLSANMVNRLEEDGQLENITYDSFGNLFKNDILNDYFCSLDEYTRFKFEKVFT